MDVRVCVGEGADGRMILCGGKRASDRANEQIKAQSGNKQLYDAAICFTRNITTNFHKADDVDINWHCLSSCYNAILHRVCTWQFIMTDTCKSLVPALSNVVFQGR